MGSGDPGPDAAAAGGAATKRKPAAPKAAAAGEAAEKKAEKVMQELREAFTKLYASPLMKMTDAELRALSPDKLKKIVDADLKQLFAVLSPEKMESMLGTQALPQANRQWLIRTLKVRVTQEFQTSLEKYLTKVDDLIDAAEKLQGGKTWAGAKAMRASFYTKISELYAAHSEALITAAGKDFVAQAKKAGLPRFVSIDGQVVELNDKKLLEWSQDFANALREGKWTPPDWYFKLKDAQWISFFNKQWKATLGPAFQTRVAQEAFAEAAAKGLSFKTATGKIFEAALEKTAGFMKSTKVGKYLISQRLLKETGVVESVKSLTHGTEKVAKSIFKLGAWAAVGFALYWLATRE